MIRVRCCLSSHSSPLLLLWVQPTVKSGSLAVAQLHRVAADSARASASAHGAEVAKESFREKAAADESCCNQERKSQCKFAFGDKRKQCFQLGPRKRTEPYEHWDDCIAVCQQRDAANEDVGESNENEYLRDGASHALTCTENRIGRTGWL